MKCECEHESHFEGNHHEYGKDFHANMMYRVRTAYTTLTVCHVCKETCLKGYIINSAKETNGIERHIYNK